MMNFYRHVFKDVLDDFYSVRSLKFIEGIWLNGGASPLITRQIMFSTFFNGLDSLLLHNKKLISMQQQTEGTSRKQCK